MRQILFLLLPAMLLLVACQEERPPQQEVEDLRKLLSESNGTDTFEVLQIQYAKPIVSDRENGPLPKGTKYFPVRFIICRSDSGGGSIEYDDDEYFCRDLFGKWVRAIPPSNG
jgi:hypothetical protein